MAIKHEAIVGRKDLYKVDPTKIIIVDGWNERQDFGNLEELADSILNCGLKVPIQVCRNDDNEFELVDGERRLRAIHLLIEKGHEIKSVSSIMVDKKTNEIDKILTQLLTNEGKPFTPIEEAGVYNRLVNCGLTVKDIHKKTGKSLPHVYQRLELCRATPEVISALKEGKITINEARQIATSATSVEGQKEKLKEKKTNGAKAKKGVFDIEKIKVSVFREFKKVAPTKVEKKKAISELKKLIAELEKE